ncbi:C6 finger domain protein, putative [Cordyceps militaris CM01]|uniref:C6 finger domain protein, putative n=1 Tax=Cordyceps militaris (strain CM01) TaxID=983644 RepID=G3JB23_CORMM|nr:C6 finger domain protein, putative [Cordyceps militaris CM01]EGX95235.1 C6 finger domain protein, putative [Cordyceps militaris CM01]
MDKTWRRSHYKSRSGCAECKRRRIKCDEVRPACGHCVKSGRVCPYRSPHNGLPGGVVSRSGPATPASAAETGLVPRDEEGQEQEPTSMAADMTQLRLLKHFLTDESFRPLLSPPRKGSRLSASQLVDMAMDCEYLMTEILAVSATHLALVQPDQRATHRAHSARLHARAVALFSAEVVQAEARNPWLLAVVFFSWLVGMRMQGDWTLEEETAARSRVLPRFFELVEVLRGVRAMTKTAWSGLTQGSEDFEILSEFMEQGLVLSTLKGKGNQTALVRLLVQDSLGLSDEVRAGCLEALNLLQVAIDAKLDRRATQDGDYTCMFVSFSWPQMVSQDFLDAAGAGRPEPMLVLAFFAVLLHWSRRIWVFGDTGHWLLNSISSNIGPGWERWLHWPQTMVGTCVPSSPSPGISGDVVEN